MDTRDKHGFESHSEDSLRNVGVSYEPRDLGARGILVFLVVLFVAGVAIHLVVWGLYAVFTKQAVRNDPQLNPLAASQIKQEPNIRSVLQNTPAVNVRQFPEPRLQADDTGDMDKLRVEEETILNSTPWKDQAGTVHISINDAMQQIAKQGLPSRPAPAQTSAVPQGTVQGAPMIQTDSGNINLQNLENQGSAAGQNTPNANPQQQ
jgi:hypothetical protein